MCICVCVCGGGDLSVVLKPASTLSHITEVDPGFKDAFKKGVCGRCVSNKHRARISALQLEHPVFFKKSLLHPHTDALQRQGALMHWRSKLYLHYFREPGF